MLTFRLQSCLVIPKGMGKDLNKVFRGNRWTKRAKDDAGVTDSSSEDEEPCASIQQEGYIHRLSPQSHAHSNRGEAAKFV